MTRNPYEPPAWVGVEPDVRPQNNHGRKIAVRGTTIAVIAVIIGGAFAVWVLAIADGFNPFLLGVSGWVAVPYFVIGLTAYWISSTRVLRIFLAITLMATTAFGMWAFDKVNEDAQGGIILLFAPACQMAGACLAAIVVLVFDKLLVRLARSGKTARRS